MLRHDLIREFARENFGPSYYVVPNGQQRTFQPLALIIKEGGSFRRDRRVVLETLDKYLTDDVDIHSEVKKLIDDNLVYGQELRMDGLASASSSLDIQVDVADNFGVAAKANVNYGQLKLGMVQEEYYKDMALQRILRKAKLDSSKLEPYEKKKLYLITNVVYSTELEITGDRDKTEEVEAKVAFPRWQWLSTLQTIKATASIFSKTKPPAPLGRQERSPLLFAFAKIKYDSESHHFKLKQLVGAGFRAIGTGLTTDDVVPDDNGYRAKYFLSKELCVYDDLKRFSEKHTEVKMDAVFGILQESESFSRAKIKFKKILHLVSMAISKDGEKLAFEVPLSKQDKILLRTIGIHHEDLLNGAKLLRLPSLEMSKAKEFCEILRIFTDMEENEWLKIKTVIDNIEQGKLPS